MRIELLLFLSFLALVIVLIACSVPRRQSTVLSPTLFPTLQLIHYDPKLVTRVSLEADIAITVMPPKPPLPALEISPPRCYRTLSPQLTCLGYLYNRAKTAIGNISLAATFSADNDKRGEAAVFSLEQHRIPAAGKAPYRLYAPDNRTEDAAIEISLEDAALAPGKNLQLIFEDRTSEFQPAANEFRLQGELRNESGATAKDIRLIITLEDETGTIIAYRAVDLPEALPSNSARSIDESITALAQASDIRHYVTVHAVPAE